MSGIVGGVGSKSGVIGKTEEVGEGVVNVDRPGFGPYTSDEYTTLLIHSDTTNGSTTFIDSSPTSAAITNSNASHKTDHAKIGKSSIYFDNGDFLTVPDSVGLSFGRKAFTIDYWMKHSGGATNRRVIGQGGGVGTESAGQWFIRERVHLDYGVYAPFDTTNVGVADTWHTTNLMDGYWHHICLTKGDNEEGGTVLQMAIDGTFPSGYYNVASGGGKTVNENTDWRNLEETVPGAVLHIGGCSFNSEKWQGWLDEIRISKGIQRWKSNFTVG